MGARKPGPTTFSTSKSCRSATTSRERANVDPLCYEAAKFIIETNYASTAQLQSQFSIGHPRAVRLMKQLEEFGVVGQHEGTKPRQIIVGLGELETIAWKRMGREEAEPETFRIGGLPARRGFPLCGFDT